jgi:hypothetical protein
MKDYTSIDKVLCNSDFVGLRDSLYNSLWHFQPHNVGGNLLYYHLISEDINQEINKVIDDTLGIKHEDILTFARLNTPKLNTEFRIHSDGVIFNREPNLACVYYLKDSDTSGTSLYRHPRYGDRWDSRTSMNNVHLKDDGLWEEYHRYYAGENSMFLYNAQLWHGRFPWKVEEDRIVIVKFMVTT